MTSPPSSAKLGGFAIYEQDRRQDRRQERMMNGDGFYGRQTGDVVLYDEQAWIIEDRYMVRGFPLVDLRDNDGWHQSEVPAWNVKPTEES